MHLLTRPKKAMRTRVVYTTNLVLCCLGAHACTKSFILQIASPPPLNVQATQSSSSAPVEVSWSPPSDGTTNITGYRIFYGSGQSVLVPSYVTSINFNFVENQNEVGQNVSVRSESMQLLPSELMNTKVTEPGE